MGFSTKYGNLAPETNRPKRSMKPSNRVTQTDIWAHWRPAQTASLWVRKTVDEAEARLGLTDGRKSWARRPGTRLPVAANAGVDEVRVVGVQRRGVK